MSPILKEVIGISASTIILISMLFKTSSAKGSLIMRLINAFGSIVFVVYAILISSISTMVLNGGLIIVHAYYITTLIKELRSNKAESKNTSNNK